MRDVDLNLVGRYSEFFRESPVNIGKTLFAQLMDFLPWSTFTRIVARYGGDARVRTLCCAEQYRAMAFAQLTYRESLRDIEVCLSAQASKLYHMGFREPVRRSTLADANETRDWRIYAEFAHRLIAQARKLYADESLGLELTNTVYALNSTTIDLCLSLFPWAHFRSTKAAVKMHTLLDLRGNIPSFIHISDGKLHDVHALDPLLSEAGAIYVMDRGYVDFARLYVLHQAGAFFVTRAKSNLDAHRVYSASTDRAAGIIADQTIALDGYATSKDYPIHLRRVRFKDPESGKTLVFLTNQFALPAASICALYKSRWQVELFFKWIKQHLKIKQFYGNVRQRGEDANLDRGFRLCLGCHRQEAPCLGRLPLCFAAGFLGHPLRENTDAPSTFRNHDHIRRQRSRQPIKSVQFLTGQQCKGEMIMSQSRSLSSRWRSRCLSYSARVAPCARRFQPRSTAASPRSAYSGKPEGVAAPQGHRAVSRHYSSAPRPSKSLLMRSGMGSNPRLLSRQAITLCGHDAAGDERVWRQSIFTLPFPSRQRSLRALYRIASFSPSRDARCIWATRFHKNDWSRLSCLARSSRDPTIDRIESVRLLQGGARGV